MLLARQDLKSVFLELMPFQQQIVSIDPDFKGCIHDAGSPTADFRQKTCSKQEKKGEQKKQDL